MAVAKKTAISSFTEKAYARVINVNTTTIARKTVANLNFFTLNKSHDFD